MHACLYTKSNQWLHFFQAYESFHAAALLLTVVWMFFQWDTRRRFHRYHWCFHPFLSIDHSWLLKKKQWKNFFLKVYSNLIWSVLNLDANLSEWHHAYQFNGNLKSVIFYRYQLPPASLLHSPHPFDSVHPARWDSGNKHHTKRYSRSILTTSIFLKSQTMHCDIKTSCCNSHTIRFKDVGLIHLSLPK